MMLQLILNEVTQDLKSFQAYQGKIQNHKVNTLHDKLRTELIKSPTDPLKIYSIEEQISYLGNEKFQEWVKRFNSWEIINMEKSHKGFCALNKTLNKEVKFIITIKNTNYNPQEILRATVSLINIQIHFLAHSSRIIMISA